MRANRRTVLRSALLTAGGAIAGATATELFGATSPPLSGGYAAAADRLEAIRNPSTTITYYVETDEPVVAFTFDDGPGPRWTPMALDALDDWQVPATFFMVGRNVDRYGDLVRGRLARHEVGNHSWSHADLATLDLAAAQSELLRADDAIERVTGRRPTVMRPPYGHLAGSTVLAADALGHAVVLWSHQMHERRYVADPAGQVRDIVDSVTPGAIVLAHDVGAQRRLVALRHLGEMFAGLRRRGFRLVTVSQLLALGSGSVRP
ncbi:polysaccharide deacetylase family protein [Micromonospora sp. NPDC005220]|uniref:polysaccharide deacetylase family protein n=1 Tax=Micromonospora sp. NPDC005220 TaxID=3155589 RepID=UPI0033B64CED